ncbi:MAG TPA: cysteine hydrolase family protein [Ktedonobacteraceae bacterium]|nr:cysteine hydrolase family protein [Ktedonobacteraceae bacterium]
MSAETERGTALVIIDTQVGLIEPAYKGKEVLENIGTLIAKARAAGVPVLYVQHNEDYEEGLKFGSPQWQIHPAIAPQEGEPVVHKQSPDSFVGTTLQQELEKRGIKHLVIVGLQSNYCVDTTSRRSVSAGYDVTLVGDAHTTEDNDVLTAEQIIAHHNSTLNGFWAGGHRIRVRPTSEVVF